LFERFNAMPSGYEKSPDYGGPESTRWGIVAGIVAMVAIIAALAWWLA
jgi:hypothetical protein